MVQAPKERGDRISSWLNLKNPRVSVIIPTYNHAYYLGQAMRSVLDQTYRDFEIIVVDDGSTDNTPEVIATFGQLVRCIRQENRGLAAARNTGILAAKGKFIGLLDADDMWTPEYLATMLPVLESDEAIGAVYCGWRCVDAGGSVLPRVNIRIVPPDQLYESLAYRNFLVPSGVLVRWACFDRVGLFDEGLRASEDYDMWLRLLVRYRMVGVPQALVKYRIHGENMSRDTERMGKAARAVKAKHFGVEEGQLATWPVIRRRAYGGFYLTRALAYFWQGDVAQGHRSLQRAFVVYPQLARDLDAFYELSCAHQPLGLRGVFEYLDFEQSAQNVLGSLKAVFRSNSLPPELRTRRSQAYGYAYVALGLLAYGCRRMSEARHYTLQAIRLHPPLVRHPQVLLLLLKCLLGARLVDSIRSCRTAVGSRLRFLEKRGP